MQLCRDCQDKGQQVAAMRFIGKTPVCDAHMRERLGMGRAESAKPKPLDETMDEDRAESEEEKTVSAEKCGCGRDLKHRGRCAFRRAGSSAVPPPSRRGAEEIGGRRFL